MFLGAIGSSKVALHEAASYYCEEEFVPGFDEFTFAANVNSIA